jgi:hypothetical protein
VTTWYGIWAPKGTPADVQARIVEEIRKAALTRKQAGLGQQGRRVRNLTARSSAASSSSAGRGGQGAGAKLDEGAPVPKHVPRPRPALQVSRVTGATMSAVPWRSSPVAPGQVQRHVARHVAPAAVGV